MEIEDRKARERRKRAERKAERERAERERAEQSHRERIALWALARGDAPDHEESWTVEQEDGTVDRFSLRLFGATRMDGGCLVLLSHLGGNRAPFVQIEDVVRYARLVHEQRYHAPLSDLSIRALDDAIDRAVRAWRGVNEVYYVARTGLDAAREE